MSTGLYIPGRQIIEVSLPEAAASADLKVRHAPSPRVTQKPGAPAFIVGVLLSPPTHPAGNVVVKSLSRVRLSAAPWTVAHQAPLSVEFSRKDDWSRLHFPLQLATQGMYFCPLVA